MTHTADQVTFTVTDEDEIFAQSPAELRLIASTIEDIGTLTELWEGALETFEGKKSFPYWTGGDEYQIHVEKDGTWFSEQTKDKESGIKISNEEAKVLIKRLVEALS